jgi:hypothetical protein
MIPQRENARVEKWAQIEDAEPGKKVTDGPPLKRRWCRAHAEGRR